MNKIRIDDFFRLHEFACPCCNKIMLDEILYHKLYQLRIKVNSPIIINSGYRCQEYNKIVGGVAGSYHTLGLAVDISIPGMVLIDIYHMAKELNFTGIGFYELKNFLHLDVRPGKLSEW